MSLGWGIWYGKKLELRRQAARVAKLSDVERAWVRKRVWICKSCNGGNLGSGNWYLVISVPHQLLQGDTFGRKLLSGTR